jgi:hypothetical protein
VVAEVELAPKEALLESWFCEGERYGREVLERGGSSSRSWFILGCLEVDDEGE